MSTDVISTDDFFAAEPAPADLGDWSTALDQFVQKHAGRKIALVTSGGTTIPLELNTVRFLDNFSAGTRGATSAELFLEHGYAVIFLHRKYSLAPFSHQFSSAVSSFLDFLQTRDDHIEVKPTSVETAQHLKVCLEKYNTVKEQGTLLQIPFITLADYLWKLRLCTQKMNTAGKLSLMYLAAAVSDFYLPTSDMAEHKIQSSAGPLDLHLKHVPKMLKEMMTEWSPNVFAISFKLETDSQILISKATDSLKKYHQNLVVANLLQTRKDSVVLVGRDGDSEFINRPTDSTDVIEVPLIARLVQRHDEFISQK